MHKQKGIIFMTIGKPSDLNEESRQIWEQNAAFWDGKMGDDGNDFHRLLVAPANERLLNLQPGETVLEIACGNGVFARRMVARHGIHVVATDFSAQMLAQSRAREHADSIDYRLLDATSEEQIVALGQQRFDAAVCNQAIMDMTEIDPLMRGIRQVVKPGGRFVFSLSHPCFNHTGITLSAEETTTNGEIVMTYAVKVTKYLHNTPEKGIGIIGQPASQYYFDRPLHVLFNACFRAGLVLDGLEEPAFNHPHDGSKPGRMLSWANYNEIPPVLVARLRITG
jgi:2-polyprenyl-3-methyl-5-hydroxy-6-metoxy-1,4-benzoquinol methylase